LKQLRERLELDFLLEDIPTLIRESKEGIGRVAQIVKDLKDFSRVDNDQWQWASLQKASTRPSTSSPASSSTKPT
jgi:signal transduction histidine kinase